MKKTRRLFIVLLLLIFLVNVYYYVVLHKDYPQEPGDLTVIKEHLYLRYPVYFVGSERIIKDYIRISHIWKDRFQNAVESYFYQSELPYESRGDQILQIPVDKLTVTPDRIYVYTSKEAFEDKRLNSSNFYYYLMSFVNTLTDGSRARSVSFIFDGKAEAPVLYGIDMNKTFSYDASILNTSHTHIVEFMRKFFVDLYGKEHQAAYRKLSTDFKRGHSLSKFSTAFDSYVFHKNNEFPWDFIVEKEQDQFKVSVVYLDGGPVRKESWYVKELNGRPYLSFSQDLFNYLP